MTERAWCEHSRDRLPRGWAYPLGRDRIAAALTAADGRVGSLSLGRPDIPRRWPGPPTLFDVFWVADAGAGYFGRDDREPFEHLLMRWTAVPAGDRQWVTERLEDGWLERGCRWAAQALTRGNAWSASEHRFLVTYENGTLAAVEY